MPLVTVLVPLLYTTFMKHYNLNYEMIGRLSLTTFLTVMIVSLSFGSLVDRFGMKIFIVGGHLFLSGGFILFAFSTRIAPNHPYPLFLLSTVLYSIGGGCMELLLSAIVESIPSDEKAANMSYMHSFFAWGLIVIVVITTLLMYLFGELYWPYILLFWSLFPLLNAYFLTRSLFPPQALKEHRGSITSLLKNRYVVVVMLALLCAGASEITITQWASTYAEAALQLPKALGNLIGLSLFALLLGAGRLAYSTWGKRYEMWNVMFVGALFTLLCYLVTALVSHPMISLIACAASGAGIALLWPGSIVLATRHVVNFGAGLFALLGASGSLGSAVAPWLVGVLANNAPTHVILSPLRIGMLGASFFPLLLIFLLVLIKKMDQEQRP